MNHKAIDHELIDLLRNPPAQRTQQEVAAAVSRICVAAQLETETTLPLQQEQLKLLAIVEFLACDLQATYSSVSLALNGGSSPEGGLNLLIRKLDGTYLIGCGVTAEQALRDMHDYSARENAA